VTDALNLIIPGLVSAGDHIVTTNLEHNSVIRPVNHMVRDHGAEATYVPFDSAGFIDTNDIARAMRPNTRVVIVNHGYSFGVMGGGFNGGALDANRLRTKSGAKQPRSMHRLEKLLSV